MRHVARCELYAVPTPEAPGYRWRWRALNGDGQSRSSFVYFYECMEDALANGHAVDFEATFAATKRYGKDPAK